MPSTTTLPRFDKENTTHKRSSELNELYQSSARSLWPIAHALPLWSRFSCEAFFFGGRVGSGRVWPLCHRGFYLGIWGGDPPYILRIFEKPKFPKPQSGPYYLLGFAKMV